MDPLLSQIRCFAGWTGSGESAETLAAEAIDDRAAAISRRFRAMYNCSDRILDAVEADDRESLRYELGYLERTYSECARDVRALRKLLSS